MSFFFKNLKRSFSSILLPFFSFNFFHFISQNGVGENLFFFKKGVDLWFVMGLTLQPFWQMDAAAEYFLMLCNAILHHAWQTSKGTISLLLFLLGWWICSMSSSLYVPELCLSSFYLLWIIRVCACACVKVTYELQIRAFFFL